MDLLRLIDPNFGLVENEHTGKKFGLNNQLTVVGWSGKYRSTKIYILVCSVCAKDSELFGEGYFKSTLPNLLSGRIPCGCAKSRKWSEMEYWIQAKRMCNELGLTFVGWEGGFTNTGTMCKIECPVHEVYSTTSINSLLNQRSGCRKCTHPSIAERFRKTEHEMIEKFMNTGMFHPDTSFTRSELLNKSGHRTFWNVFCPQCGTSVVSHQSNLSAGKVPCACSYITKMTEAYINVVSDSGNDIALKFGISSASQRRLKTQSRYCIYDIRLFGVWIFPSFVQCRRAENNVKQNLVSGILDRKEMPDGFTETTHIYNLDRIISIYEKNGGVRVDG